MVSSEDSWSVSNSMTREQIGRFFVFALMWSVGALLELDGRSKLESYLREHKFDLDLPDCKENETIFEYVVDKVTRQTVSLTCIYIMIEWLVICSLL